MQQRPERLFKNRQPANTFEVTHSRTKTGRTWCIRLGDRVAAKRTEAGPAKNLKFTGTAFAKRALAFAGSATDRTKSRKAKIQQIIQ